jgi:hypothetical protein
MHTEQFQQCAAGALQCECQKGTCFHVDPPLSEYSSQPLSLKSPASDGLCGQSMEAKWRNRSRLVHRCGVVIFVQLYAGCYCLLHARDFMY